MARILRLVSVALVLATALLADGAQAAAPSDPLASPWTYDAVDLPAAWDVTTGSPDVVIAVVDSGIEGHNFLDESSDTNDPFGHGTAVAGILAARANNGLGAAGVCWSCRLLPLRVLRPEGFAYKTTIARAIDYAVDHGAAVVGAQNELDFVMAASLRTSPVR